ncbi:MAG: DNA-3-methyladenine glycosylase 2 family protein [Alphaproteobacteria bacterium]
MSVSAPVESSFVAQTSRRRRAHSPAAIPRLSEADLHAGLAEVCARDPDLAAAHVLAGPPPALRTSEDGLAGLLRIVVGQQVSAAAARSIWQRIRDAVDPLDADTLLDVLDRAPEALGLSRQKRAYARGLAEAIAAGTLAPDRFPRQDDETIVAAITALKGFGRWSAEVYLLFALGRRDAWPAEDLALAVAVQRIKRLDARPKRPEMERIAAPWRPWRGNVAMFLWHYYHATGGQKQFADGPSAQAPAARE